MISMPPPRSILIGVIVLSLLFTFGCTNSKNGAKGAEDMIDLPEVVWEDPGPIMLDPDWEFVLEVERFAVFYHEGLRSELSQEGSINVEGDTVLVGDGEGGLDFEFMVGEPCPLHMITPIRLEASGKLNPDCTFEFVVSSETEHGRVWSECSPDIDLPPNMFDVLFADFDQPTVPVRGRLIDLWEGISREEPGGVLEWTANYRLHDFYGSDPYGCYKKFDP